MREKLPEEVPEGVLPAKNYFLVVDILEENAVCPELEEILAEYRKPVVLQDDVLGELTYDKLLKSFEGNIAWLRGKIHISLYVDKDNKSGITKAKKALKSVQDSVSLSHLVPNSKVCHQEPEVLLVKEDLVGCHTQTS